MGKNECNFCNNFCSLLPYDFIDVAFFFASDPTNTYIFPL